MRVLRRPDEIVTVLETELMQDGDPDVSYRLRRMTRELAATISKRHTTRKLNKGTRSMEDQTDTMEVGADTIDHVIVDWSGWEDGEGRPVPCTREAKLLLPPATLAAIAQWAADAERRDREDSFRGPEDVAGVVGDGAAPAPVLPDGRA